MSSSESSTSPLRSARLIYVAPEAGSGGVGDYASDFVAALRPHFGEVVEFRRGGIGTLTWGELRRARHELRELVGDPEAPRTVIHAEQSGGGLLPFWGPMDLPVVANTATVHDPPLAVWFPLRTRFIARTSLLNHLVNGPMSVWAHSIERRVERGRHLFTLTGTGADALRKVMTESTVSRSHHYVPDRPPLPAVADRPLAVGLFGYVYRGKGFDALRALRDAIDPDIAIRVAGRGTQHLPQVEGVDLIGPVEGAAEDEFFASVRMIVMPYRERRVYRRTVVPAAGTIARGIAYRTPVVTFAEGPLRELGAEGGVIAVEGGVAELAATVNRTVRDRAALDALEAQADLLVRTRSASAVARDFVEYWESRW